ncbi:hypothetical protein CEXT_285671 [Caerostris extrusa]|uniref:Uncharacterized protein n=1 Tax=Caerostris extrusa TaxID=172846 RepID=A0AAV4XGG7_CAEEX|nr:hypothetical protein CEXT_285671 [Caerostris extrusa]
MSLQGNNARRHYWAGDYGWVIPGSLQASSPPDCQPSLTPATALLNEDSCHFHRNLKANRRAFEKTTGWLRVAACRHTTGHTAQCMVNYGSLFLAPDSKEMKTLPS